MQVYHFLLCVLVAHVLHIPVPFPDLDGGRQGTPTAGISDLDTWQIVLVGVLPNEDIDRGPIRNSNGPIPEKPQGSPFGPEVIVSGSVCLSEPLTGVLESPLCAICQVAYARLGQYRSARREEASGFVSGGRGLCVSLGRWLV